MATIALKQKYLIKESVGATSLGESYLIVDPQCKRGIASVEEVASTGLKIAKAFLDKAFLPLNLIMNDMQGENILKISHSASLFNSVFIVYNDDSKVICRFKQKCTFMKPAIIVEDAQGQSIGKITGNWRFKHFQFKTTSGSSVSTIKHISDSIAKSLFTTADDYELTMNIDNDPAMTLISLAATVCIDFVYHEN